MLNLKILSFCVLFMGLLVGHGHAAEKESTYERVMRTGIIRCGYGEWSPIIIKDAETGQLSGIFYEYAEALGKELSLKVQWVPLSWSSWVTDLETGKYDAACVGIWPLAARAKSSDFVVPIYYHALYPYVRTDDTRFDGNIKKANNPEVTFVGMDGTVAQALAAQLFPRAKLLSLPESSPQGSELISIATNKADIIISDMITAELYLEKNPGSLRRVRDVAPTSYLGNTIAVKIGEDQFRRMLDNATRDLLNRGVIQQIIDKYQKYEGSMIPVAKPYEVAN